MASIMCAPARRLMLLLAGLLLVQWMAGLPAHARAMAAVGEDVVICSPDGMRTLRLGPDGQPIAPQDAALGCCLLCLGPVIGGNLASGPDLPPPSLVAAPDMVMATVARTLALRPPLRIHHSRAPPTL